MSETRGASLKLRNLCKRYGDVIAASSIDLDVEPGGFVTLLGPSGSGKTTVLMGVSGLLPLDSGEIFINEVNVTNVPPRRRNIGMVFQSYALFPHMTVAQNVAFPLKMRSLPRLEIIRKVSNGLDKVQLSGFEERRITQLSGGQQQRVALARALVFEPSLLLMDEPLSALDKKLREEMQLELKQLQQRIGVTVLYVTHDQSEALILSSKVAIMNQGDIEQIGSPVELYNNPQNRFVSSFLGESNLIPGKLDQEGYFTTTTGQRLLVETQMAPGPYQLMVRPEWLSLASTDGMEGWQATVLDVVFFGEGFRYLLGLDGGLQMVAKVGSSEGSSPFHPNDTVIVSFKKNLAVLIPGSQEP